jgi:predicted Zn-dependent peptidase
VGEAAVTAPVAAVAVGAAAAAVGRDVVADVPTGSEAVRTADPGIEKTVLPSGIRVVTERMPEAKSVAIGVWVGVGSRDESDELAGASHFLEHLLFKGTAERSARSIATAIDAAGGEMNAFTTRESTAFYTRLPVDQLDFGIQLLADVVSQPAFRPPEVDAEREVILEEILMSEDAPDDVAMTALYESLFPAHGVGRETLGSRASIEAMPRDVIADFHRNWYRPANLVVVAAGDLHHAQVLDRLDGFFTGVEAGARPDREAPGGDLVSKLVIARPTEQAHLALGWHGSHYDDPDRYALWVANHVFGGGMSSRLFQEVREERGLAYTVYTSPSSYQDCGSVSLYAGTAPRRLAELVDVINGVVAGLVDTGITNEEHEVAVGYLTGSMLLGLEDTASRMARLGSGEITRDHVISIDEHLERIRSVTVDEVHRVIQSVLDGPRASVVVGPFDHADSVEL